MIPRVGGSEENLHYLLLEALTDLTMGIEQEVFSLGDDGALVDLNEGHPEFNLEAKSALPPSLGKRIRGPVAEGGASIREFITDPISPNSRSIQDVLLALNEKIHTFYSASGLVPLYACLPLLVKNESGMGITKHPRYEAGLRRDPRGIRYATKTASIQVNIGTIPPPIRAVLVGMMGDSAHEFVAASGASPFSWTSYDEGVLSRWSFEQDSLDNAYLVDTGMASSRLHVRSLLTTGRHAPVAHNQRDYDEGRRQHLINARIEPIPKNYSLDHALVRITDFGIEIRSPDSLPTTEERELLCLLSLSAHIRNIQRLAWDSSVAQAPLSDREKAMDLAIQKGLTAELVDAETRLTGNAFAVLKSRLTRSEPALRAFEHGNFKEILSVQPTSSLGDVSRLYKRALNILNRLQEIGSPAERQRSAIAHFRERSQTSCLQIDGKPMLSRSEALFLHCYLLAEQQHGLFGSSNQVFESALSLKSAAESNGLSLVVHSPS